ncbi:hypothetical protein ABE61_18560 [Lysinibacillus sphaericus]|nr:hypothetical protein [Lysinibacillus sphaericus]MBG9479631.1 hypothetical protein [Lysinibacillus sphaericus]MBG9593887.1 hypothetical protein [Lysinibacillus sphaericus]
MAEDVGAELFLNVGEGSKTSDGLVEHLDGRGDAFLVTEHKVRFYPFSIFTQLIELPQFFYHNIININCTDTAQCFWWSEIEITSYAVFRIYCFVDVNNFFLKVDIFIL